MPFIRVVSKGKKTKKKKRHKTWEKSEISILGTGSDLLTVLVPLEIDGGVGQVHHQADLATFIHLIGRFQFLCECCEKKWAGKSPLLLKLKA